MTASRQQVIDFLGEFKHLIELNRFHFVQRLESNKTIVTLGLTKNNARRELLSLSVSDFSSGPTQDREIAAQEFWIFGKELRGIEAYIKLKIYEVNGIHYAKCVSFHEAEFKMKHPFQ
ncbi:MAG: hypothetical protein WCP19_12060 [Chloroflexota bacterium]